MGSGPLIDDLIEYIALHDTLVLPWDYSLKNGVMTAFARTCSVLTTNAVQHASYYKGMYKTFESILTRVEDGIHGYACYGFSALLRRKTQKLQISQVCGK